MDAGAALRELRASAPIYQQFEPAAGAVSAAPEPLRPNEVARVKDILSTYPGSRFGNAETRGLDTEFAFDTYVPTELDKALPAEIAAGDVSLVILCGNAGDGKTAFLQRLVQTLGGEPPQSSERVWTGSLAGRTAMINLDGAASWKGRSADSLLDELFGPFLNGPTNDRRVHLVAVNDGRLMEWIERYEREQGETALTLDLAAALSHPSKRGTFSSCPARRAQQPFARRGAGRSPPHYHDRLCRPIGPPPRRRRCGREHLGFLSNLHRSGALYDEALGRHDGGKWRSEHPR